MTSNAYSNSQALPVIRFVLDRVFTQELLTTHNGRWRYQGLAIKGVDIAKSYESRDEAIDAVAQTLMQGYEGQRVAS